jgi:hypothetical protein
MKPNKIGTALRGSRLFLYLAHFQHSRLALRQIVDPAVPKVKAYYLKARIGY